MTWFKVDDCFYDHPKVIALEEGPCFADSIALWLLSGTWSARQLTDGFVPDRQVRKLGFLPLAAEELVRVRLWHRVTGGYQFHQWDEHQPAREEVEARRRANTERVAKWRERKGLARENPKGPTCDETADKAGHDVAGTDRAAPLAEQPPSPTIVGEVGTEPPCNAVGNALPVHDGDALVTPPRPVPSRPDPTRPVPSRPIPLSLRSRGNSSARARQTPGQVSGAHLQEFDEILRAEALTAGYSATPRLVGSQLRDAADRAREMTERTSDSYPEAARKLIRAALAAAKKTGKAVGLLLLDIEPSRPVPDRANSKADTRAPATTHEHFANVKPVEVQLAELAARWDAMPDRSESDLLKPKKNAPPKPKYASDEEADAAFRAQLEILKQKDMARHGRTE